MNLWKYLKIRQKSNYIDNNDDLTEPNVQYDNKWQLEHPGLIDNLIKSYNEQLLLINKHQEINLFVFNHCDHPYNDIDIHITATLEKNFIFTVQQLIKSPRKPIIPELNVGYGSGIPLSPQQGIYQTGGTGWTILHNLQMSIESEEKEKHTKWKVIYHVDRIKHNTFMELHPILLFIPDSYKTKKIQIKIAYTHEEIGSIKEQIRIINLPQTK